MILTHLARARARRGFTLVELMVAASMCVLGMWLFTWLYKQGLDSFRTAKAQADLMSQERSVIELLRRDLTADHFLDEDRKSNHGRKLSDQLRTLAPYALPRGGYLQTTGTTFTNNELTDSDGFGSWRSNHAIRFTVVRPGGTPDNQYSVQTPAGGGNQYGGVGAEVAYFLIAAGRTPGGVQLYDLYRRQRLVALNDDYAQAYNALLNRPGPVLNMTDVGEVFALRSTAAPAQVATFADLRATAGLRVPFAAVTTTGRVGDDKILSNVVSFELKYTGTGSATWPTRFPLATTPQANSDFPYDWLPANVDSGNANQTLRLTGVQVRLRVWNPKTLHTRQTSIVVDL